MSYKATNDIHTSPTKFILINQLYKYAKLL